MSCTKGWGLIALVAFILYNKGLTLSLLVNEPLVSVHPKDDSLLIF